MNTHPEISKFNSGTKLYAEHYKSSDVWDASKESVETANPTQDVDPTILQMWNDLEVEVKERVELEVEKLYSNLSFILSEQRRNCEYIFGITGTHQCEDVVIADNESHVVPNGEYNEEMAEKATTMSEDSVYRYYEPDEMTDQHQGVRFASNGVVEKYQEQKSDTNKLCMMLRILDKTLALEQTTL